MEKTHVITVILIISALTFLLYANVINGEFQFDDDKGIADNIRIKNLGNFFKTPSLFSVLTSGRPVTDLTFALNYHFGRLNPTGYHIINILLHISVSILIYFFIRKTLTLSDFKHFLSPEEIALFISSVFAVHPINTQAVSYISQRAELLSALFYLASFMLFIKAIEQKSILNISFFYLIAAAAFLLSVSSKTTAVSLPFVLFIYDYWFFSERSLYKRIKFYGPLIACVLVFISLYISGLGMSQEVGFSIREITPSQYLLTQFRVVLTYMRLLILPVSQNLDYQYQISKSLFEIKTLLPAIFIFCLITLTFIFRKKNSLLTFGILWFFLLLSPTSSVVPVVDVIYEHRVYLASLGFFLSICLFGIWLFETVGRKLFDKEFINKTPSPLPLPTGHAGSPSRGEGCNISPPLRGGDEGEGDLCDSDNDHIFNKTKNVVAVFIAVALIASFSFATQKRNVVWKTRLALWSDVVSKSPGKPRAHYNLGHAFLEKGRYPEAIKELNMTLKCDNDGSINRADVFGQIGAALIKMNMLDDAISVFKDGPKLSPGHLAMLNNLSIALIEKGQAEQALPYAEMALMAYPSNGDINNTIGEIYLKKGEYSRATQYFIRAIEINPDVPSRYWYASISMEKAANIPEARRYMEMYIALEQNKADRNEAIKYLENLRKMTTKH